MHQLYTLHFNYPEAQYDNTIYKDSMTAAAAIELYARGIHVSQSSATTLVFESERDRTFASLLFSSSTDYELELQ